MDNNRIQKVMSWPKAAVEIVKTIFRKNNFRKAVLLLLIMTVPLTAFILKGGLDFIMALIGVKK